MTHRFPKAKSRLQSHEQTIQRGKTLARRMGKVPVEESVKVPKIGEWTLADQSTEPPSLVRPQTAAPKRVKAFPDIPLTPSQTMRKAHPEQDLVHTAPKTGRNKGINPAPIYKLKPPRPIVDTPRVNTPQVSFPVGTMTTDLDAIIKSRFRQPPKEQPRVVTRSLVKEEEEAPFMPLEIFDDSTYEEFPLDVLMATPVAFSRYHGYQQKYTEWMSCTVLSFEPETGLFLIEWQETNKRKKVARFNVRFERENEEKFNQRVDAAKRLCKRYETQVRFDMRVEQMSKETVPGIAEEDMAKIIRKIDVKRSKAEDRKVSVMRAEVEDDFATMSNQLQFVYELKLNRFIPDREAFLELLSQPGEVPESGLVDHDGRSFAHMLHEISKNHLQVNMNILTGLQTIWGVFIDSENLSFLKNGYNEVMALDAFVTMQYQQMDGTAGMFKESIQDTMEHVMSTTVNKELGFILGRDKEKYEKMLIQTTCMLHTVLLHITGTTVGEYKDLFAKYVAKSIPKIIHPPQFSISLAFEENHLTFIPAIDTFKDQLLSLLIELETTVKKIPILNMPMFEVDLTQVKFDDCVEIIVKRREELEEILEIICKDLEALLAQFRGIEPALSLRVDGFAADFDATGKRSLDDYRKQLAEFYRVAGIIGSDLRPGYVLNIFDVECETFRESSSYLIRQLVFALLAHMKEFAICDLRELQNEFQNITDRCQVVPNTPEELAALKDFMDNVVATTADRTERMSTVMEHFAFLEEFQFEITNEECQEKYKTLQMPHNLSTVLDETDRVMQVERIKMIRELRSNQRKLEQDTLDLTEVLPAFIGKYQDLDMTIEAMEHANEINAKLEGLKVQQTMYTRHEKIFHFDQGPCRIVTKLADEFKPLHALWSLSFEWYNNSTSWIEQAFASVRPDQMNAFLLGATKKIVRMKRDLASHPVLIEKVLVPLRDQIEKFKQHMPLITKLRHPGIKTKHWEFISEIVGFHIPPATEFTLKEMLDMDLGRWSEKITELAAVAAQEYNIESALDAMDNELNSKQMQIRDYKDTNQYIFVEIDDIQTTVEDQLVTTQTLLTSPFIGPSKHRALERLTFLRSCSDTVDAWIECQRGWLYLQPIFTGTSIQQKLHREARDWRHVDETWSSIMNLTNSHPEFISVVHRDTLLPDLKECNVLLESITQGLNAYLEAKRLGFPRFFFLSNDELISILSHTKDFDCIQKSMQKLFEYVASITVDEEMMITEMLDDGLEKVQLVSPVDGNTHEVEDWLNNFEDEMRSTLKAELHDCIPSQQAMKRDMWLTRFPAQVLLITNQIAWTHQVSNALESQRLRQLKVLQKKFIGGLEELTAMIRTPLTPAIRQIVSCLLILEVHNRDIISELVRLEISDVTSFKWLQQLRYYWEDGTVMVRSINNTYEYSYEYAGNSARLVITPLTDRCYQTLLSAFRQNMSGAPSGPAGTGKTETVRDCAKALGRSCVVYNCSEEVTPEQMSQFFAGLASSGSWSCFDEFNRINIEVLSVIAQQVRTIQAAIAASVETFILDARTLKINGNAAVCITMNPGYAGRTELPDNLKALFRPCAMMVPDFGFIAEIMLFSGGFASASVLSVKLVALFDLCMKQLSNAHHYDWGLRAMKAILSTVGKAKRLRLDEQEALLLVEAIRDCTKPRLVSRDIPLFEGIIHDVFPDVAADKKISASLEDHLTKAMRSIGAQPLPLYLLKCNEIYETTVVRHGIMFVGGAMGGKSTCWRALQKGMSTLAEETNTGMPVSVETLNPKSVTIPELYGLFDPVTSGWSDGILSKNIRDSSASDPTEYRWIVVDGPVDSLWIETMNSLLDDNKVLCLSNNERISLGSHVRLMFEVDDLSQASPATVSRCGMIYFDPSSLPWNAIADSWVQSVPEELSAMGSCIRKLMDAYLPQMLNYLEADAKVMIGKNSRFLVQNLVRIIDCYRDLLRAPIHEPATETTEARDIDPLNHELFFSVFASKEGETFGYFREDELRDRILERVFVFAVVWSFGSVLDGSSRNMFDKLLREAMERKGSKCKFPGNGTCFDFYPDFSVEAWLPWCDTGSGISLTSANPIEQQLIPTNESAALIYVMRLLVKNEQHVLLHGPESSKSLVVNTLMRSVLDGSFECNFLPMSHCSTSSSVMSVMRSFLHKRQGVFGPMPNQHLVVSVDNLNAVKPEMYGSQPALELLRQLIDAGGWYNTANCTFQKLVGTTMIGTMGMTGGGLFSISDRLLRHFSFMHVPKLSSMSMSQILTGLLAGKLSKFQPSIQDKCTTTVQLFLDFQVRVTQAMLPIPSKLHYIFSLRNIVRVIKGLTMPLPSAVASDEVYIKLVHHELQREFFDRFNTEQDRQWFMTNVNELIMKNFRENFDVMCPNGRVMFNGFADRSQAYKEIKMPEDAVLCVCQELLEEHNAEANKPLEIVLFKEAIDHLSSLCRILDMRRGHAMLVGVKASGRKSLARLALHISGMEMFEIQVTRSYGLAEWREDMKELMKVCGKGTTPIGFVLSDIQILGAFQLEDISNMLVSGVIPNLFERDEMDQIKADIAQAEMLIDEDPWAFFQTRIKKNLHVVLVFSPFGSVFKDAMLSFPALRSETTIDWYMPWSNNALERVGKESLRHAPIGDATTLDAVVSICVKIHKSVEHEAARFARETKRFTACTPSRYFELLGLFVERLKTQQTQTTTSIAKYSNGVDKINATRRQIKELSRKLDHDIPILQRKREEVEAMLKVLEVKQGEVEETRAEIVVQSQVAEKEAEEAKETNRIAQEKFDAAMPILKAAQDAVDSMDKDSLVNIKSLKKVHPALRETFEAICIVFDRKPRKVDGDIPGQKIDDYWPESLSLLNDVQFVKKVKGHPVEEMSRTTVEKLRKYVGANKQQRDEKLMRVQGGYQAVANLYMWVCAAFDYWFVYQEILPKKLEAEEAARKLAASEAILASRKAHLASVEKQLADLMARVDEERANEKKLSDDVEDTKLRLNRAEQIMNGLSGETARWTTCAEDLRGSSQFLLGDSLLIAGCLTHLGAFSPPFRLCLLKQWNDFLDIENIRRTSDFSITPALGIDSVVREWVVKGLPNDTHSIENALIIDSATSSVPLFIDPQLSGTKWLRAIEGDNLIVLRFDQSDFLQRMKNCVTFGSHVLIENVGLKIDPIIEPILSKEFVTVEGVRKVMIGGEFVNVSDNFRLFMCTKYPNPQYSPEVCSQVTLMNFTTTQEGLADLIMNNLIEVEQSDLARKRVMIMEEKAKNTRKLKDLEEEILAIVSSAGSDILNDDRAIATLSRAQVTSADISTQLAASAKTERLITDFRARFVGVADRAALLYFCSSDFAVVDPMYQFSLNWFVALFKRAIQTCEHPDDHNVLINKMNDAIAEKFCESVSFSLFSKHKLLFSTLMSTRILMSEEKITSSELAFLLQPNPVERVNPYKSWLPDEIWRLICAFPSVSPAFEGMETSLRTNEDKWKTYMSSNEPENETIPYDGPLTEFQRLLLLRTFHLHRVREGLRVFVAHSLGKQFVSPPALNLGKVFKESSPMSPLVFIITPGIDPQDEILGVAASMDLDKYLKSYSLGRGRGDGAEELIIDATERGFWVLLQNCHLSLSWMPRLEQIIDNIDSDRVHERFRLCLVTMSSPEFPIGILYRGVKLIYEIPKGIRENMLRIYNGFNADEYDSETTVVEKQLTFHLAFFHAIVLERLQFGSIGWNIPYEFNPSDFAISRRHLRTFLSDSGSDDVPFEALTYVIGELNYGGRVTDRWDRRLLLSLLQKYFSEDIMTPGFSFGTKYVAPEYDDLLSKVETLLNRWPIVTDGEDVGLSMNASTITARNDAMGIFNSIVEIQPTAIASSRTVSEEEFTIGFVTQLTEQLPAQFNVFQFTKKFDLEDTINTVLHHEILLYNKLLDVIKSSLSVLEQGLKGMIVIDQELELLSRRLLANKIPEMWLRHSFPSILPLRDYMNDLKFRAKFLSDWIISNGRPTVFKLGAFFHPEEFLTAVLQVYARKHSVPFDTLRWETKVLDGTSPKVPEDGILVEGLYIEGSKWDVCAKALTECGQRELISTLPIVHLFPTDKPVDPKKVEYECPMYRTQSRGTGALDLPNYLMSIGIPTGTQTPDHWIQRSVAVFVTV